MKAQKNFSHGKRKRSRELTKIYLEGGGLPKNHFWLVATQKERIGEQLNYFWNMCPKPFSWAKNKRKRFSDGKSRGPLLEGVALNSWSYIPFAFLLIQF